MTQIKLVESESQADSASYNHLIFIVLSEAHNSAELLRYKHTFLVSRTAFRISELYSARNTVRIFINRLVPLTFGFYSISIQVYGNLTKYEYICENIYIYMHVYISISIYICIYLSMYVIWIIVYLVWNKSEYFQNMIISWQFFAYQQPVPV